MTFERFGEPTLSVPQVKQYLQHETSLKRRMIYVLLLLLDAGVLVLLVALWSTESQLPLRTHVAFGAMVATSVVWLVLFGWVLSRRRPLFALERVMSGQLALAVTTLFLLGGVVIAVQRGHWWGLLTVTLVGGMFVMAAAVILVRAIRTRRSLLRRRAELAGDPPTGG
jgi:hypothetical protein